MWQSLGNGLQAVWRWFKGLKWWGKTLVVLVLLGVIGAATGNGSSKNNSTTTTTIATTQSTASTTTRSTASNVPYGIGPAEYAALRRDARAWEKGIREFFQAEPKCHAYGGAAFNACFNAAWQRAAIPLHVARQAAQRDVSRLARKFGRKGLNKGCGGRVYNYYNQFGFLVGGMDLIQSDAIGRKPLRALRGDVEITNGDITSAQKSLDHVVAACQ